MYPMFCRTRSGCFATSIPATLASPEVGCSSPHNMRIVVDFPAPFGSEKSEDLSLASLKADVVHGAEVAKAFHEVLAR